MLSSYPMNNTVEIEKMYCDGQVMENEVEDLKNRLGIEVAMVQSVLSLNQNIEFVKRKMGKVVGLYDFMGHALVKMEDHGNVHSSKTWLSPFGSMPDAEMVHAILNYDYDLVIVRLPVPINSFFVLAYYKFLTERKYTVRQFLPRAYHEPIVTLKLEKNENLNAYDFDEREDMFMAGIAVMLRVLRYGVKQRQRIQNLALKVNLRLVHERKMHCLSEIYPEAKMKDELVGVEIGAAGKEIAGRVQISRMLQHVKKKNRGNRAGKRGDKADDVRKARIREAFHIEDDECGVHSPVVTKMLESDIEKRKVISQAFGVTT